MKHGFLALVLAICLATPGSVAGAGRGGGHTSHSSGSHSSGGGHSSRRSSSHRSSSGAHAGAGPSLSSHHPKSSHSGVHRSGHGKIKRDPEQRAKFMRTHPCPSTGKTHGACPGYVVDHITPLKRGGKDDPSNMQWQTKEAAKEKDKWE